MILTLSLFRVFDSELKIHYTNIASRTATGRSTRNNLLVGDDEWSLTVSAFLLTSRAFAAAKNMTPRPATLALLSPASAGCTTPWPGQHQHVRRRAAERAGRGRPERLAAGADPDSLNSTR